MSLHEQAHVIGHDLSATIRQPCPLAFARISSLHRAATRPARTGRRYLGHHAT